METGSAILTGLEPKKECPLPTCALILLSVSDALSWWRPWDGQTHCAASQKDFNPTGADFARRREWMV